jgi:ABC-type branched-subunit amino acid transport system ATPase component
MDLTLEHVTKTFGGIHAVEDVSMRFSPGEITALIGPNGAGKTTLFNLISGQLRPDQGTVRYKGDELTGLAPYQISRRGVGRLFQDVRLFGRMTVLDNVRSAFPDQRGESAWRAVLTRWRVNRQEQAHTERAMALLEQVGLTTKTDALGENLSYGQQKLAAIARLLAMGADALLLDEPVAGVNPDLAEKLLETVRRLADEGKTVALIEHNMNAVLDVADRAYFMDDGRRTASGEPREVLSDPDVRAAYMGMDVSTETAKESIANL